MPASTRHILSIDGLDVSYRGVRAVRGFSLDVAPGEIVGLVGESGSGKSTVLRAVAGLLPKSARMGEGSIVFMGRDPTRAPARETMNNPSFRAKRGISGAPTWGDPSPAAQDDGHGQFNHRFPSDIAALRGREVAYVFQDPIASLDPLQRVGRQFGECLSAHGIARGNAMRALMRDSLEQMGFDDVERVLASWPHELSGGMCQRVVLAISAALSPALLLADEPTSALDVAAQRQVSDLLLRLREEHGMSMVVVSHNIAAIALVADRIGVMRAGELVELGTRDQVLRAPAHPYTAELIAAVPKADGSLPGSEGVRDAAGAE